MNNPTHSIAVLNCGGNANRTEPYRTEPYRTMQWKSAITVQLILFDLNVCSPAGGAPYSDTDTPEEPSSQVRDTHTHREAHARTHTHTEYVYVSECVSV